MTAPQSSAQATLPARVDEAARADEAERHPHSMTLTGSGLVLVWLLSIGLHLLLLAIMFALVFPYGPNDEDSDLPIAKTEIVGSLESASFSMSSTPDLTETTTVTPPDTLAFTPKPPTTPIDLAPSRKPDLSIVGIGAGGGDFSRLGLSIGGSSGPKFFGLGASAREAKRIVYVVDRSGSMLDTFQFVQAELHRSINELRRSQKFHVIFFNNENPLESPPRELVSAIDKRKEAFFEFLERVRPSGGTEPSSAIYRALSLEPDLVYLLSDGIDFDPELLRKIATWNAKVHAKIFTIAYVDRAGRKILERIARDNDGEFTFVSEDDFP